MAIEKEIIDKLNIKKIIKETHSLCDMFEELKLCNTKDAKIETLKKFSSNEDFNKSIEILLNNDKITGIGKKKLDKLVDPEKIKDKSKCVILSIPGMLNYLVENNTGKDSDVLVIQEFLNLIPEDKYKEIIKQIATKTYKIGVTDLTAYGIIPGLERNWKERKGHSLIDNKTGEINISKIKDKNILATLKLDGFRYKICKYEDRVEILNASGKKVEGLVDLEKEANKLPVGIYDGECIAIGEFKDSTERFNATSKILARKGEKKNVKVVLFDYIDKDNMNLFFDFKKINTTRINRFLSLKKILKDKEYKTIELVPTYIENKKVNDEVEKEMINKYLEVVEDGEEGLVIDIADAPYERKKGNSMFKLKPELTGDFKVIDLSEGIHKYEGKLGAFIIEYKGNTVNVGSGISDEIREEVWSNKEKYLNKLIEVTYFGETQDEKTKLSSLRLPRFKRFRHDKTDISYD